MPEPISIEQEIRPNTQPIKASTGVTVDKSNPTTTTILDAIEKAGGRIPFSEFMDISLYGENGYYKSGKVKIGIDNNQGDFTTSPETSEMFGATLGKQLMHIWTAMGKPEKFEIVEMGAGNGTMAMSILKWMEKLYPDFYNSINYLIVEYGKGLIPKQQQTIDKYKDKINWIMAKAYELPLGEIEGAFISNELPDAFPVEIVREIDGELKQKYIKITDNEWVEEWDKPSDNVCDYIKRNNVNVNDHEQPINLHAEVFQQEMDRALKKGAIITIDYGGLQLAGKGNSATRYYGSLNGKYADIAFDSKAPYQKPGDVDITADVNFGVLETIAKRDGLDVVFSGRQAELLDRAGILSVTTQAKQSIIKEKKWQEIEEGAKKLQYASKLVCTYGSEGNYYSHILTKGIRDPDIMADKESAALSFLLDLRIRDFVPIKIADGKTRLTEWKYGFLPTIGARKTDIEPEPSWLKDGPIDTDAEGNIYVNPLEIQYVKFTFPDGRTIDLSDKNTRETVIRNSGYII
ncbi:SAM-dependent methyltransferase [Patescibacteria group bacterium]|nr:SAM-dependent methyltransferase [Patescibacteria group bacterium]MCL5010288.1 SAM-dependent methyltransferase [Patescibacteria group bacterium]